MIDETKVKAVVRSHPEKKRAVNGRLLRKLRGQHGWTWADLARESGVAQPTIRRLENQGLHRGGSCRVETAARLAQAFGVRLNAFSRPIVTDYEPLDHWDDEQPYL